MPDCYDTRSFSQSTIDAIMEIWDSATMEGRRMTGTESCAFDETTEVFPAFKNGLRRSATFLDEPEQS